MKYRKKEKKNVATLKIDISKAYDRVDWNYLKAIILKLSCDTQWVKLIILYICMG